MPDRAPLFKHLEMEPRSGCNLRCATCPNHKHQRPAAELPFEVMEEIFVTLGFMGFEGRFAPHFYNEPLTDPRLPRILAAARRSMPRAAIELFTNCTLLTPERFRELAPHVDAVVASVDEPVIKKALDALAEGLTEAERGKLVVRHLHSFGLSNRCGAANAATDTMIKLPGCLFATDYMTIDAAGDVHLCCNDYFGRAVYGNVKERHFLDIWRDPAYVAARAEAAKAAHPLCAACLWEPGDYYKDRAASGPSPAGPAAPAG